MKNKYLIIGASSGIGRALTEKLASEGNEIIAISREPRGLDNLENVIFHAADMVLDGELPVIEGPLAGLAYCPGSINLRPFNRLSTTDFQNDININLMGAVKTIQHALPALRLSQNASIVLFSTVAVQAGMGFHASIAAAKGAVEGLTRALAAEFAPAIRVNCIAPSLTDTPLAERLLGSAEKREAAAARNPLKLVGTADDVASMAAFLLSENARWITGQVMAVDGGMSSIR